VVVVADDVAFERVPFHQVPEAVPGQDPHAGRLDEVGAGGRDGRPLFDDDDVPAAAAQEQGQEAAAETGADDRYIAGCRHCHDESPSGVLARRVPPRGCGPGLMTWAWPRPV